MNTYKWSLTGKIQRYNTDCCDYSGVENYEYWVDGQVDDQFEKILEQIGLGKKVKITIETCEVK